MTYVVQKRVIAKIRYIAAKEGLTISGTVDAMLSAAIDDYEAEHGEIPVSDPGEAPSRAEQARRAHELFNSKK